jgi:transcriptional regulator with XRE-family HTH domain
MDTSKIIKHALTDAGISAKELAERMGRAQSTVYEWTGGRRQASIDTLEAIAEALGGELVVRIEVGESDD